MAVHLCDPACPRYSGDLMLQWQTLRAAHQQYETRACESRQWIDTCDPVLAWSSPAHVHTSTHTLRALQRSKGKRSTDLSTKASISQYLAASDATMSSMSGLGSPLPPLSARTNPECSTPRASRRLSALPLVTPRAASAVPLALGLERRIIGHRDIVTVRVPLSPRREPLLAREAQLGVLRARWEARDQFDATTQKRRRKVAHQLETDRMLRNAQAKADDLERECRRRETQALREQVDWKVRRRTS